MVNKVIKKYVDKFGKEATNEIIQQIKRNNWIRTGSLIDSIEYNNQELNNKFITTIEFNDYAQYLKISSKPKINENIVPRTNKISSKVFSQGVNIDLKVSNFITDTINPILKRFDYDAIAKEITEKIINDLKNNIEK